MTPPGAPVLPGQPNFRDLGGHRTRDGRFVRTGMLYRAGEIHQLGDADRARFEALGIRTVVDLRSDAEVAARGVDVVSDGVRLIRIPIAHADRLQRTVVARLAAGDYAPPSVDLMIEAYRSLLVDWSDALRWTLDAVLDEPLPLVFHCTHGKDRTGLAAALLLIALGVDAAAVEADYLRSNDCRAVENDARLEAIRVAAAQRGARDIDLGWVQALFAVERRYLEAALVAGDERFGDRERLFTDGLRLDEARRARLRERLLTDACDGQPAGRRGPRL